MARLILSYSNLCEMELTTAMEQFFGSIIKPLVVEAIKEVISTKEVNVNPDYITVEDACKLLHCSGPTLYNRINKGEIKVLKNGRSSLINKVKLIEDLESGKLKLRKDKHRKIKG